MFTKASLGTDIDAAVAALAWLDVGDGIRPSSGMTTYLRYFNFIHQLKSRRRTYCKAFQELGLLPSCKVFPTMAILVSKTFILDSNFCTKALASVNSVSCV